MVNNRVKSEHIRISKELKDKLDKLKIVPEESYDGVIVRVLKLNMKEVKK